jgi:hypothetical protein
VDRWAQRPLAIIESVFGLAKRHPMADGRIRFFPSTPFILELADNRDHLAPG